MPRKPDILLFLSDDHGAWANGCYGARDISTPNIDHLAARGVLMENAYTPTPVCSPARACIFTGRIPSQHGVHDYLGTLDGDDVNRDWLAGEHTLQATLAGAGYQTALVGKWHLGQECVPKSGFGYSCTIGPEYPIFHGGTRIFYRGDVPVEKKGYLSRIITDEALDFLRGRDREKPFFLVIGQYATHSPWAGHPERLVERYRRTLTAHEAESAYPFGSQRRESLDATREDPFEAYCQYCAGVTEIDESVGRVMDELEAQGIMNDTLVIYTSDHGLNCGHHGLWGKGNASFPLNMLERSLRVPLVFHAPSLLFGMQRRSERVDHTDLYATLLDFAGIGEDGNTARRRNSPGASLYPLLTNGDAKSAWRDLVFGEYGPVRMASDGVCKLCLYPEGMRSLLFDLRRDPGESENFYDVPAYRPVRDALAARIAEHFGRYREEGHDGAKPEYLPRYNGCAAWEG